MTDVIEAAEPTAPPEPARTRRRFTRIANIVTVIALAFWLASAIVFVVLGRVNGDEGWYLYASRLVYEGKLPYHDFAFTQTPLLPYVYGLPQLIARNLYLARACSVACTAAALVLLVRSTRKLAGPVAGMACAVLLATFPFGTYHLAIVKTYPLLGLGIAGTFAALVLLERPETRLPVAIASAAIATMTRSSALPLAIAVIIYAAVVAPDARTRRRVAAVVGAVAVIGGVLVFTDLHAATYGLLKYHQLEWHGAPTAKRVDLVFLHRLPSTITDFPAYFALILVAVLAVVTVPAVRRRVAATPGIWLSVIGLVGFAIVQSSAGQFYRIEYFTPITPIVVTVSVIVIAWAIAALRQRRPSRALPAIAVIGCVAIVATTLTYPDPLRVLTTWKGTDSVQSANAVAAYLHAHTRPDDKVLALTGLDDVYLANRQEVSNATLGLFAYEDVSDADARRLHLINQDMLVQMLQTRGPAAVVLTGLDVYLALPLAGSMSQRPADRSRVLNALWANYHLGYQQSVHGRSGTGPTFVYLRN
jgi:hypothetical protein